MSIAAVLTVVVALIIGFDVPARIGRALRVDAEIAAAPVAAKPLSRQKLA